MKAKHVIVLILLFAGVGFYFGCNRVQNIKDDHQKKVDSLNQLIHARGEIIWQALADRQTYLDSVAVLNSLNDKLEQDYLALKARKVQVIEETKDVPPDTAYQALQDIYPDAAEKPYPFSPAQVKSIHIDVISVPYLDSLVTSLEMRTSFYGKEIALQRAVIHEDSVTIDNLMTQGGDYREIISLKNQQIVYRDKKLRRGKFIKAGIGVGAFIVGILVAK